MNKIDCRFLMLIRKKKDAFLSTKNNSGHQCCEFARKVSKWKWYFLRHFHPNESCTIIDPELIYSSDLTMIKLKLFSTTIYTLLKQFSNVNKQNGSMGSMPYIISKDKKN